MNPPLTPLYTKAVNAVAAVAESGQPPETVRVELEALKAMVEVLIGKLPKEEQHAEISEQT